VSVPSFSSKERRSRERSSRINDDRNVPFQQTTDLVQKLRAKGDVYFELMIVPDEPHVFLLYKNRMECYKRAFEFINRFIGK